MTQTLREEMEQVAKNHRLRAAERKLSPVGLLIEVGTFLVSLIPLGIAVATGHLNPIIVGAMVVAALVFLFASELRRYTRRRRHRRRLAKNVREDHIEYILPSGDRVRIRKSKKGTN